MNHKKCVIVIGPESSGSMLIAKICSHVLGIDKFGEWNGVAWSDKGGDKVCHRSLPYGNPSKFPNIMKWIKENEQNYDIYFILTTRDVTLSEISRLNRWSKPYDQIRRESLKAKEIMNKIMGGNVKYFLWSYETFMFLEKAYLDCLYNFLNVESEYMPNLMDANKDKIKALKGYSIIKSKIKKIINK